MSGDPLLSVQDLSVAFSQGGGETLAVDHVSFDIGKGETVALVGESGSGKSVSALSILKLLPYPSASHPSGRILFGGDDLLAKSGKELRKVRGNRITMIFQEPMTSLNPLHTIEQQVAEVLKLHQGMGDRQARTRALANDVIVMRNGRIVEQGSAEQIFERPQTDYTRALISAAFRIETASEGVVSQ